MSDTTDALGLTTQICAVCLAPTEYVQKGVLYRKERLLSRVGKDERCDACGSVTSFARERGYVDIWIADSMGMH